MEHVVEGFVFEVGLDEARIFRRFQPMGCQRFIRKRAPQKGLHIIALESEYCRAVVDYGIVLGQLNMA